MALARAKRAFEIVLGQRRKKLLKHRVLQFKTAIGIEPFTAAADIDRLLLRYLPRQGFFVEAGANDGISQSNTYYLEKRLGWTGLLIEPVPQLAFLARRFRANPVVEVALGGPEIEGQTITLTFDDLTSGIYNDTRRLRWNGWFGPNPTTVIATGRTLSSVLTAAGSPHVDLLSLDVENQELAVLRGLDLRRHAPSFILIETTKQETVRRALASHYDLRAQFSEGDHLFKLRD